MVKKLTRKKNQNQKEIHPNSRKAKQITKQAAGIKRRDAAHILRKKKNKATIEKYIWFKEQFLEIFESGEDQTKSEEPQALSHENLANLVSVYLSRFDSVNNFIENTIPEHNKKLKRNKNCAIKKYAGQQDMFKAALTSETNRFKGEGLLVPDLTTKVGFKSLVNWDGSEDNLPTVETILAKECWLKSGEVVEEEGEKM